MVFIVTSSLLGKICARSNQTSNIFNLFRINMLVISWFC